MPAEQNRPLRLALVHAAGAALPIWVARLIERLHNDPAFSLAGTIEGEPAATGQGMPLLLSLERLAVNNVYRGSGAPNAEQLLAALPELGRTQGRPVADIALALSGSSLPASDLGKLVTEEWSLQMADAAASPETALMKALASGEPLIPLSLVARTAQAPDGKRILRAQYNIKPSAMLLFAFLCDKAVPFVQRALTCRAFGREIDTGVTLDPAPVPAAKVRSLPYPALLMKTVAQRLGDKLHERFSVSGDNWELHIGDGRPPTFGLSGMVALPRLHWTMADPFLIEHDGALFLFFEALDKPGGNAWIEVCRLNGNELEPLGAALRCDYHLSFPQVFSHAGEVFMLPETQQTNRLEVWRATRFPLEWELHATALEGLLPADSCLYRQNGKWWLFSNLSDHHAFQEHSSALYLFQVSGPDLKQVVPHRFNPVVIGSDVSRNAGGLFIADGQLFRPSQNNSYGVYGYGLNLMRIDRMDEQDYGETLVRKITPADLKGARGVHHVTFAQDKFVLDVYVNRPALAH